MAQPGRHHQGQGPDTCIALVPVFQALSRADQLEVATVATPTQLTGGQIVYAAGSDVSQLLVVHTGRLKITRSSADGQDRVVRVLEPGDFVGEASFLTGVRPDHTVTTLEPASLCVFKHADLAKLVAAHPTIAVRMLQTLSRRLTDTETRLAAATSTDVSARLAGYLLSLPGHHGDDGLEITLPLAKKDIASLLDTTPESLSRALRRLSDSGMIDQRRGRRIGLSDVDGLALLADDP